MDGVTAGRGCMCQQASALSLCGDVIVLPFCIKCGGENCLGAVRRTSPILQ